MGIAFQHNVGAFVAIATGILPQSSAAAVVNGAAIDRFAHGRALCCVLHQVAGAVSGAPTAISVVTKLQHSPDGGTTWSDYLLVDGVTVASTTALVAGNSENSANIDLSSAYRHIRAVATIGLTGGATPAILLAVDLALGGEDRLPAS